MWPEHPPTVALFLVAMTAALEGCASVAQADFSSPACASSFSTQLSGILVSQGEAPATADTLATQTRIALSGGHFGPRPFLVPAPSGTDYEFFVEHKEQGCLLRLYARQKGFTRYTNDLTYIDTRALPGCSCKE